MGNCVDNKGDVRVSESKVLETADNLTIFSGIGEQAVVS